MIKDLQYLKALERALHGTLAFRSYLPTEYRVIQHNQDFGSAKIMEENMKSGRYGNDSRKR